MEGRTPPDRGRFVSENPYDSLGEEEAGLIATQEKKTRYVKSSKKVKYSPWEFSPTLYECGPQSHTGKYIVVETTSEPKLTELSLFTVETVLNQVAPNYITADRIRDGKILILTKDQKSAKHALSITEVKGICSVKVTNHNELNQIKGTIYCEDLLRESLEDIKERLKSQKVVDVRRATKMEKGEPVETPLHILTFDSNTLEPTLKVGWRMLPVRRYYPSPLKCSKCLVLGHTKKNCPETNFYCQGCAQVRHDDKCKSVACRNCPDAEDPHATNKCPKLAVEKAIIEIKENLRIPYARARIEYNKRVEKAAKSAETQAQIQQQQELYRNKTFAQAAAQDTTQQQILKTLELLQRKIENIEKVQSAMTSPNTIKSIPKRKTVTSDETEVHSPTYSDARTPKPAQTHIQKSTNTTTNDPEHISMMIDDFNQQITEVRSTFFAAADTCASAEKPTHTEIYVPNENNYAPDEEDNMPITHLINTRKNNIQKQQSDQSDLTMETEFRLKRPNTTLPPPHKSSSTDGKKKKTPNK